MRQLGRMLAVSALLLMTSCDTPGVQLIDPEVVSDPSSGVTFQVYLEDSAMARTLGWSDGVPGAYVILQRVAEPFAPESLMTNDAGEAFLPDFLPGQYKVAAHRVLSANEALATTGVVRAFGDGWIRDVNRGQTVLLQLIADNPGTIVFSEWYDASLPGAGGSGYTFSKYLELYNNSDSTVYLDGMLLGIGWLVVGETPDLSCAESAPLRIDPLGIWSMMVHAFPGSGRDFPVPPAQAITVARDAVDHSVVHNDLPDLSDADFELEGAADTDNPDVPNLPFLGPVFDMAGHGMPMASTMFLAHATAFESLDRRRNNRGFEQVRVPTELMLDVIRLVDGESYSIQQILRPCGLVAPRSLERLEGGDSYEYWDDMFLALHRRILRTTTDGRFVLQDVNTSFLDFVLGPRSSGRIEN